MKILIALAVIVIVFYWSFQDWRRALKGVFFVLVIEGALRKWILPQASEAIYFLKDLVLLGAYFRYFIFLGKDRFFPIQNTPINVGIFAAAGWCLFQSLNPNLGSPLVGVIGLRAYLYYIPIIWMTPSLFESEEDFYRFLRTHLLLTIPVGLLGIVQFFSPSNSPINQYAPGIAVSVATFGFAGTNSVRITGTFSYINSYQGYLSACFALLLPLMLRKQEPLWKALTLIEIFLVLLNSLMTGSRTPVLAAILIAIGFWVIRALRQPETTLLWLSRLLPFILIAAAVAAIAFQPVLEAFWIRSTSANDLAERIQSAAIDPFSSSFAANLDGYGTGATHPGTTPMRNILNLPPGAKLPNNLEIEMPRIAIEMGPIGFAIWYGLRVGLICALGSVYLKLRKSFFRDLALSACMLHIVLFTGQMVFHHIFSIYYWFTNSFIFLLPWLDYVEAWREQQQYLQFYESSAHLAESSDGQS